MNRSFHVKTLGSLSYPILSFFLVTLWSSCNQRMESLDKTSLNQFCDSLYSDYSLPGLGVAILYGEDEFLFSKGVADDSLNIPFSESSQFFTGSFSEVPVTMALSRLREQGVIDFNIPFRQYTPYLAKDYEGIEPNVHQLMNHTSGIEDTHPSWDDEQYDEDELQMTSKSIAGLPLLFTPGTKRTYCGYGFDILADIMQKATDQKFEKLVDSLVFEPLDMSRSTFDIRNADKSNLVKPQAMENYLAYTYKNATFYPYSRENAGAHGFHSSLSDMLTLFKTLLNEEIDSVFRFNELFKRQYKTSDDTYAAYGWQVLKIDGSYLYEHTWRTGGLSGSVIIDPAIGFAMVSVTNTISEFVPTTFSYNVWKHVAKGEKIEQNPPYQIEMSKQVDRCIPIDEVLKGYEEVSKEKEPRFSTEPEILAGLYANMMMEDKNEQAQELKEYIRINYPKVYDLVEPPPVD